MATSNTTRPGKLKEWLSGEIRTKLGRGDYRPGSILQSERKLSTTFGVSRMTVRGALEILAKEGLVELHSGRGAVVTNEPAITESSGGTEAEGQPALMFVRFNAGPLISDMADGIHRYCRDAGIECLSVEAKQSHDVYAEYIRNPPGGARRILLVPVDTVECRQAIGEALDKGISILFMERSLDGTRASSVEADNFTAGYKAGRHLLDRWHVPVYCVGYAQPGPGLRQREQGWQAAMAEHGFADTADYHLEVKESESLLLSTGYQRCFDLGFEVGEGLFKTFSPSPNGWSFYCCSDLFAVGIYRAAEKLGLRIGQDVRVVGTGDYPLARRLYPALSSVDYAHEDMGYRAARLLHLEADKAESPIHQVLPVKLVERESSLGVTESGQDKTADKQMVTPIERMDMKSRKKQRTSRVAEAFANPKGGA